MKAILVLVAFIAFTQAAHQFYYAGTTNSTTGGVSPTAPVAVVTSGACAPGTVSGYQKFTLNATANPAATFYWITAMFEKTALVTAQFQVYNGAFDPTNPCTNLLRVADASGGAPHASSLHYLTPGLYDVVVTTTDPTDAGVFAIHADRATGPAQGTTDASPYMLQQYTSGSTCSSYSTGSPYVYFQFTATNTTEVDIFVYAYNGTVTSSNFVATLYNTSGMAWLGTGNATNPVDGCVDAYWVAAVGEETSYTRINQNNYAAAVFQRVPVVAGWNYTIVASGYNTDDNNIYGVWWRPTTLGNIGTQATFYRPSLGSDTCTNGTSGYYWKSIVVTAQYSTYVMDNGYAGFDTAACLYSGNNLGSADQTVGPVPCPPSWLQCIDTGDIGPLHQLGTVPGRNYTVVQTTYSSGSASGGLYNLWVYSGTQLGPLPVTTTGEATTGAMEASSSSAAAIIASIALMLVALLF